MTQTPLYNDALSNILRIVINSSWPFYERELEQNAEKFYPDGSSLVALRAVALLRLQQIFNQVNNPNQLFADLHDALDQGASSWFAQPVHHKLLWDVDWVLYEMHRTLKSIEDEIKRLQRKFCCEDFISDLICIVSRDITGGALEIQHYAPPSAYQRQQSPHREYYHFRSALACRPTVIQAVKKRLQGTQLESYDYLGIIGILGQIPLEGIYRKIDIWLNNLLPIYREIADKYGFTRLDDMFKYILIKEQRNIDSHFENWIKDFNANGQTSLDDFVDTNPFLQGEFNVNDKNMLRYTYERCSVDLNSNLQLKTNTTITVIPKDPSKSAYNGHFMREIDPISEYRIAPCVVTTNQHGRKREPRYWSPERVHPQQVTLQFGHRIDESSN